MVAEGLVAALARCQAKFGPVVKAHENPHFKSQYADIADVLKAVRPVLAAEGIAVIQPLEYSAAGTFLVTKLMLGDEEIRSEMVIPCEGLTAQQFGSWLTYGRRYQLCALVGVHPEGDDDDGNAAQTAPARTQTPVTASVPDDWETRPLASMTFTELRGVAEKVGHAFSGGSKSELIRQLQPIIDARSGGEPFDVPPKRELPGTRSIDELPDGVVDVADREARSNDAILFNPVVAKPSAERLLPPDRRASVRTPRDA